MNEILQIVEEGIIIPACDGADTFANIDGLFYEKDPGFFAKHVNCPSDPTDKTVVNEFRVKRSLSLFEVFGSLSDDFEKLSLSQGQIIKFAQDRRERLSSAEYTTFFLFKVEGEFFVAFITRSHLVNLLNIRLRRFKDPTTWLISSELRVVAP